MRGTGEGQKVKGHKWERTMPAKLEARRKAMEGMPELIRQWKQVSLFVTLSGKGYCMLTGLIDGSWKRMEEVSKIIFTISLIIHIHGFSLTSSTLT